MKVTVYKEITCVRSIRFEVEVPDGADIQDTVEAAEGDGLQEAMSAGRITGLEIPEPEWAMTDYLVYDTDASDDDDPSAEPLAQWGIG